MSKPHKLGTPYPTFADRLNQQYFDGLLSDSVLDQLVPLNGQSPIVQATAERMCRFMTSATFTAKDFSDQTAWWLSNRLSAFFVPAQYNVSRVITYEGRHRKIDAYLRCNPWLPYRRQCTMLDLGCGFPPVTTAETAQCYDSWQVIGADPELPYCVVYDSRGDYALFADDGRALSFFAGSGDIDDTNKLRHRYHATVQHFEQLLQRLLELRLRDGDDSHVTTADDGARLDMTPLQGHSESNLSFIRGKIGEIEVQDVDIVRCFNVLTYYDDAFRQECLRWLERIMNPGGIFIAGTDAGKSIRSKYTVYQWEQGKLVEREFAFSIDNLGALGGLVWFALHDDDHEVNMLSAVAGSLHRSPGFRREFNDAADALLAEYGLYERDGDGNLRWLNPEISAIEQANRQDAINEALDRAGFVDAAIHTLKQAGWVSWRNCVGHIAVAPLETRVQTFGAASAGDSILANIS